MITKLIRTPALTLFFVGVSRIDSPVAAAAASDPGDFDGLWSGSWGLSISPDGTWLAEIRDGQLVVVPTKAPA